MIGIGTLGERTTRVSLDEFRGDGDGLRRCGGIGNALQQELDHGFTQLFRELANGSEAGVEPGPDRIVAACYADVFGDSETAVAKGSVDSVRAGIVAGEDGCDRFVGRQ